MAEARATRPGGGDGRAGRVAGERAVRTLVVWCPDWPVVAAGVATDEAAAVVRANRVVAASSAARAEGVTRGLRRREAQGRCPGLTVLGHDPVRDARAFEPLAAAVAALTPRVEVVRPGMLAFPTRGPSRYFGGDEALAVRVVGAVDDALAPQDLTGDCRVGVAGGPFAAAMAARATSGGPDSVTSDGDRAGRTLVVPPDGTATFLAPLPVTALGGAPLGAAGAELAGLLRRLGVTTLGALAALPAADVLARFGPTGATAHRLARGDDERPPAVRDVPPDLTVTAELDPPAERVDAAAFVARSLADDLHERLAARGLACARVLVDAETEHGERLARLWRHEGALTSRALADRVRWQLEGWLTGPVGGSGWAGRPSGGITLLRLVPDEVVAARGRQLGFWGGATEAGERAARGVARLEGLLGPDAVRVPRPRGGRGPGEHVVFVPWSTAEPLSSAGPLSAGGGELPEGAGAPWPGRVPAPAPAVVHPDPPPADVVDGAGRPVGVTGRGEATAAPARLSIAGAAWVDVSTWAGPWPADERWWDPLARRRRARVQVVTGEGEAHLLALEDGRWRVEATYD